MDPSIENEIVKKCFKCEHMLYENLNIVYNAGTCMIVLWNKFQIFVYEDRNLQNAAKILIPEFQIHELLLSDNYILCLDSSCNIHSISLKFKNPAQKRLKSSFQPREQNVKGCSIAEDRTLSIKYEGGNVYLCLHKFNAEFLLEKKVQLKYNKPWSLPVPTLGKCIVISYKINDLSYNQIKQIYKANSMLKDCSIVFLSFDKLTIFTCLFSTKMNDDEIVLIKLHTCPSEICGIEIMDDLTVLVCLTSGSIIRFYLKDNSKEPDIIHLNIAIDKYIVLKECFLYTDGITMWKSDKFLTDEIAFRQFIIKQVKDFVKCGDQLICTSYTNLIYLIPIDDETSYLKALTEEYCKADELLNNAEYLYKILEEIEQNNDMVKKLKEEANYITVLALSNRQDIMDTIVQQSILVYESYEDVLNEQSDLLLTDDMSDYFQKDSVLFVIKISAKILQQMFSDTLANLFNDLQIHLSFFSNSKLLKTTSLKLKESLKKISMLTSLKIRNADISEINIIIKLISSMPGTRDHKQPLWSCLYEKHISLKSEHFIKTDAPTPTHNTSLKEPEDSIEKLVHKVENNYHKQLFRFVDVSKHNVESTDWSMYLKLPTNYKDLLMDTVSCRESLNSKTADFLIKQYTSKDFLESKSNILLEIGKEKVKVQIIDDFSAPLLQVLCQNIIIAFNIRNFFSKLIYNDFKSQEGMTREFVKYTLYNVTENLQKKIRTCLAERPSLEAFKTIAEHFERNVISSLPL